VGKVGIGGNERPLAVQLELRDDVLTFKSKGVEKHTYLSE